MSREADMKCAKNLFVGAILIFAGDRKLCEVTWDPYFFPSSLQTASILSYMRISSIGL